MKKRWTAIYAFILMSIIVVCFWLFFALKSVSPIRIAISSYSGHEYLVVAKEKGFFKKANLNVELVEFGSLSDVQRAFEWGQVNGMVCNLIDVILTKHKGGDLDPKVILIPSFPTGSGATVILAPSQYNSISDLKGKKIGVEVYSWGNFFLLKALKTVHLSLDDVTLVPADPTAVQSLMRKGYIDAAVVYPPHSLWLLKNPSFPLKQLFSSNDLPKEVILDVLAVDNKMLKTRSKEWLTLVGLWDKLLDFKNKEPKLAVAALAHHEMTSTEAAKNVFDSFKPLTLEEQMVLFRSNKYVTQVLGEMNDLLKKMWLLNKPVDFETVFNGQFVREAILKNGN